MLVVNESYYMCFFMMENYFYDDSINLSGFFQFVVKLSYLNNSEIDFNNLDSDWLFYFIDCKFFSYFFSYFCKI